MKTGVVVRYEDLGRGRRYISEPLHHVGRDLGTIAERFSSDILQHIFNETRKW